MYCWQTFHSTNTNKYKLSKTAWSSHLHFAHLKINQTTWIQTYIYYLLAAPNLFWTLVQVCTYEWIKILPRVVSSIYLGLNDCNKSPTTANVTFFKNCGNTMFDLIDWHQDTHPCLHQQDWDRTCEKFYFKTLCCKTVFVENIPDPFTMS